MLGLAGFFRTGDGVGRQSALLARDDAVVRTLLSEDRKEEVL